MITSTILGLFFGSFNSIVNTLIDYFKAKQDQAHELKVLQLQSENNKDARESKLEEIHMETDLEGLNSRIASSKTNIKWVEALNQCVRPIGAYTLLFMYCMINYVYFEMLKNIGSPALFADLMWTKEDHDFLGTIFGFYYGNWQTKKVIGPQ